MRARLLLLGLVLAGVFAVPAAAECNGVVPEGPIVSIGGDVTEIVYALGAGDRVIAVDLTSRYPEAAQTLPQVGYMRQLSAEPILSLSPALILAIGDSGPPVVLDQLRAAGACLVLIPDIHSAEGVIQKIEAVGAALDRTAEATALAQNLRAEFGAMATAVAAAPDRPRVLFLFSAGEGALLVGGQGTSADAIIALAGGRNAIETFSGFKPVSSEGVIAAAPDVILATDMTVERLGGIDALLKRADVAETPAGKAKRAVAMSSMLLLGFGPRTPDAVRDLAAALHPSFVAPAAN